MDGVYESIETEGGATERVYQPRSQEELDRLSALVKNAVGFDQQRNDQIEIVNIPFDRSDFQDDRNALDSMYMRDFYMDIGKKVLYALAFIIGLLYLRKKSRRLFAALGRLMPPRQPAPVPATAPPSPTAPAGAETEEEAQPLMVDAEKRKPRLVDEMQKTAKDRPEEIAKVIKTLMID